MLRREIMDVGDAGGARCALLGVGKLRDRECGENSDDDDHDQQFDQREAAAGRAVAKGSVVRGLNDVAHERQTVRYAKASRPGA